MSRLRLSVVAVSAALLAAVLAGCGDSQPPYSSAGASAGRSAPNAAQGLGISVADGVVVTAVTPGSPSAREGLQPGDVIIALAGKKTPTLGALSAALEGHEAGERVTVAILRDGDQITRSVTLAAQPS